MLRLLNVFTLKFKEFYGSDVPRYVIASHRWLAPEHEAKHADVATIEAEVASRSAGLQKVCQFCEFIRSLPGSEAFQWLWIDTVCIDRTNSVELCEAINSMFGWYQKAYLCLAYLHDFSTGNIGQEGDDVHHTLDESEWFRRGRTLQELLAPDIVMFLDRNWHITGHKRPDKCRQLPQNFPLGPPLNDYLFNITGIETKVLGSYAASADLSFKRKRFWLNGRCTTRGEDHAYCMLGILRVSLTPIYGEGRHRAWQRLEDEARKYESLPTENKAESQVSHSCSDDDRCCQSLEDILSARENVVNSYQSQNNEEAGRKTRVDKKSSKTTTLQPPIQTRNQVETCRPESTGQNQEQLIKPSTSQPHITPLRPSSTMPIKLDRRPSATLKEQELELTRLRDLVRKTEEGRTAAVEQSRVDKASAVKASANERRTSGELEKLNVKFAEAQRQMKVLEQDNERAWTLVDDEKFKRKELERKQHELEQQIAKATVTLQEKANWHKDTDQRLAITLTKINQECMKSKSLEAQISDLLLDLERARITAESEKDQREALERSQLKAVQVVQSSVEELETLNNIVIPHPASVSLAKAPIRFKDAVGRTFTFPFDKCNTWDGMETLIKQAFRHLDNKEFGQHVQQGHYDLTGRKDEIILPRVWECTIQPGWEINMELWPIEEEKKPNKGDSCDPFAGGDPFAMMGCPLSDWTALPQDKSKGKTKSGGPKIIDVMPPPGWEAMLPQGFGDPFAIPGGILGGPLPSDFGMPSDSKKKSRSRPKNSGTETVEISPLGAWFAGGSVSAPKRRR